MEDETVAPYLPHPEMKDILAAIRDGFEIDEITGKKYKIPATRTEEKLWRQFCGHLESRGEIFRTNDDRPFYWDKISHRIYPIERDSAMLGKLLAALGLLSDQAHTKFLMKNLIRVAEFAKRRPVYKFSYLSSNAIYVYQSETKMIRITDASFEEVHLGTDDVLLLPDGLGDWPALQELTPFIEELRPKVGSVCTKPLPGLPMAKLTTRWATDALLSDHQQWTMLTTRFMFMFAASRYPTYPIIHISGMPGGGKSTAFEGYLACRYGFQKDIDTLPTDDKDLRTSIINSHVLMYDNVDGGGLDQKSKSHVIDLMCQVATGAELPIRQLYTDSKLLKYKIRCHAFLTSCTNPFERDDVLRRVIELRVADPRDGDKVPKNELIEAVTADRLPMLAEMLLRTQNIVRAHTAFHSEKFEYKTMMIEYERFTYLCGMQEDTLQETQAMWATYMRQYNETITESNAMVYAAKLWLGSDPANQNRNVTPSELFAEMQSVYAETDQAFSYKSPSAFGRNVFRNKGPLKAIGFHLDPNRGGHDYVFKPTAELLAECAATYKALSTIAAKRRGTSLRMDLTASLHKVRQTKHEQSLYDDDLEEHIKQTVTMEPEFLN